MTFESYKMDRQREWQENLNYLCWGSSILIFLAEFIIFIFLMHYGALQDQAGSYFLLRVILPSSLNIIACVAGSVLRNGFQNLEQHRNLFACLNVYAVCSVTAIFHCYFTFLLILIMIPIFLCSIFADKKILRQIIILTIFSYLMTSITLWRDAALENNIYKIISIVCCALMIFISYVFSLVLINSQLAQVEVIFANFQTQQQLLNTMRIEPLTKLSNRTAMNECAENILKRTFTEQLSPYLALIDIDHFKLINDTFGHSCGDDVLVSLADLLSSKMGGIQRAFRFGGEEFVLLFDSITAEEVKAKIENIREEFAARSFVFAGDRHFTISAGISPLLKGWDTSKWFDAADNAMYKAKNNGRNQVVMIDF